MCVRGKAQSEEVSVRCQVFADSTPNLQGYANEAGERQAISIRGIFITPLLKAIISRDYQSQKQEVKILDCG